VRQYQKLLSVENVKLAFDEVSLREMAKLAMKRKTGARGLRAVMEELMMEIMYEAPGNPKLKDIRITSDMVKSQAEGGDAASKLLA